MLHGNRYAGGRVTTDGGYVGVLAPEHPRATIGGRYVREHILLAEAALGRPLPPKAEVHHVDRDRGNNGRGNLVICPDHSYHALLHRRQRALDACGDANAQRCEVCHGYDNQHDVVVAVRPNGDHRSYHRSCAAERARQRTARRREA